jgi:hypothetical protein
MDEAFTLNEFCASEKISRAFFYKLESQGRAPRTYNLGCTRRISREARDEWRAAREAETRDSETIARRSAKGRAAVGARKDRKAVAA